jgi:hypothetical protein
MEKEKMEEEEKKEEKLFCIQNCFTTQLSLVSIFQCHMSPEGSAVVPNPDDSSL